MGRKPIQMLPQVLEMRAVRRLILWMREAITMLGLERGVIGTQGGMFCLEIRIGHRRSAVSLSHPGGS